MIEMDKELLKEMIERKYVSVRKHPTADLYIYNYTKSAQYDKVWNSVTEICRGLILDGGGNVVSRPFRKFFNLGERDEPLPDEPFTVTDKQDGSLGICYKINNEPFIATRGSFESPQALTACKILKEKHSESVFKDGITYLFEIIYPENRIVVNYGDKRDLVLLAMIDNETGLDLPLDYNLGFEVVKHYDGIKDISELLETQEENREGYVVKFESGYRVKVKFAEYMRLHRLLTCITERSIWQEMREGRELTPMLELVPDEFYQWVKSIVLKLNKEYGKIEKTAKLISKKAIERYDNRKEMAEYILSETKQSKCAGICFQLLDNKKYEDAIWKMIKPKASKPFNEAEINE